MKYAPRNDWVLVRIVEVGYTERGVALPEIAIEGKEFIVVSIGPDVEGLEPGDKVLMIGNQNVNYYPVPGSKDLLVIQEKHVVLVQQ